MPYFSTDLDVPNIQKSKYEHQITQILPFQNTQSHEFS